MMLICAVTNEGEVPPMRKDGTYAAWFKTPLGQGTGIAHVADGKIWGCDSIMTYSGSCEVDGDRFTAIVSLKRHTEGHATVFGVDDLTLRLEGTFVGKIARCVGMAEQVPGVLLEGKQPPAPKANEPIPKYDPAKLPKLPKHLR